MTTIRPLASVALFVLLTSLCPAQETAEARIVVLLGNSAPPFSQALAGFRDDLRKRGVKISFDIRDLTAENSAPEVPALPGRLPPDTRLILALGSAALEQARSNSQDIPIIAAMVLQKEEIEAIDQATGVYLEFPLETQFDWLRRFLPEARRIGVVYNRAENGALVKEAAGIVARQGLELVSREVSSPPALPAALESLSNRVDVLWGINDRIVVTPQTAKELLLFSFRHRIPFVGLSQAWVKAGAFYALDRDYHDIGRQCATMAQAMLSGSGDTPIQPLPPRTVTFSINLKTAKQMKVTVPDSLLRDAKHIF